MFALLAKQDGSEDSVVSCFSGSDDETHDMMEFTEVQSRKGKRQRMSSSGRRSVKLMMTLICCLLMRNCLHC